MELTRPLRNRQTGVLISLVAIAALWSAIFLGCASRYRLELFLSHQKQMKKVDLEGTRNLKTSTPLTPNHFLGAISRPPAPFNHD